MDICANQVTLRGRLQSVPEFSHENHSQQFFRFLLEVPRLSGNLDILPVIASRSLIGENNLPIGTPVAVTGQIRSHNIRRDGRRHLLIFVFARQLHQEAGEAENCVLLTGSVCRQPVFRRTPLGREICDVMLAVPRAFRRADYVPCILWGKTAQEVACCQIRDEIHLEGRLQSRGYTKLTEDGSEERTTYEVSALSARLLPQV